MNNLLFLHGALGNKSQFNELTGLLKHRFTTYALNFSGHGGEVSDKKFSMDLFQQDVLHFMKSNSLEKTHIFGYSMGGYVALKLALEFPEKTGKIMTLGTKLDWNPETAAKEMKMLDWKKMEEKIPAFVEILKKENHPNDWKDVVEKTATMIHRLGNGNALEMQDFKKLKSPVLATIGSEDNMVTKEETQTLAKILPYGKFMEIEGFKHPIDLVDKQILSETIIGYFQIEKESATKLWE